MSFEKALSLPRASRAPENAGKKSQVHGQKRITQDAFTCPDCPRSSLSLRSDTYLRINNVLGSLMLRGFYFLLSLSLCLPLALLSQSPIPFNLIFLNGYYSHRD